VQCSLEYWQRELSRQRSWFGSGRHTQWWNAAAVRQGLAMSGSRGITIGMETGTSGYRDDGIVRHMLAQDGSSTAGFGETAGGCWWKVTGGKGRSCPLPAAGLCLHFALPIPDVNPIEGVQRVHHC
jgi:hypothetical protein